MVYRVRRMDEHPHQVKSFADPWFLRVLEILTKMTIKEGLFLAINPQNKSSAAEDERQKYDA